MWTNIIAAIIQKLLDGNYEAALRPFKGAPQVLGRLSREHAPVLFVTARPYPGPISRLDSGNHRPGSRRHGNSRHRVI